jgi:exodeoxyribonuclease VII large subunit
MRTSSAEAAAAAGDARAVLPVSLLVSSARLILERHIGLVWVSGEISGFTRAASGHCYFKLKDAQAQVSCVFFRHKAQFTDFGLKDGLAVEVRATASLYEARGEFQLNVETVRLAGQGALYEKFARLKARLESQGWFAPERKRALPAFPAAVGIVTSTRAAALSDILTTLARRWPALRVIVYTASVQGEGAAAEIAEAIRIANVRAEVDVLIVGRGGGSIEDLWAFNEEIVAQAVFDSALPVVSAVGHETDFTICDFVADARAPTPTAAAALVAPDRVAVARDVSGMRLRCRRAALRALEAPMQRLDALERRLLHPAAQLEAQAREARALADRLLRAFSYRIEGASAGAGVLGRRLLLQLRRPRPEAARIFRAGDALVKAAAISRERTVSRLDALARSLALLNPAATLERGYSIVAAADGAIVTDARDVKPGDDVSMRFARGGAGAKITKVEN